MLEVEDDKGGSMVKDSPNSYRMVLTERHMCGLSGFNPMLGDSCPACEQMRQLRRAMQRREDTRDDRG